MEITMMWNQKSGSKNVWQSIVLNSTTLILIKGTSVKENIFCFNELIDFNVFHIAFYSVVDWNMLFLNLPSEAVLLLCDVVFLLTLDQKMTNLCHQNVGSVTCQNKLSFTIIPTQFVNKVLMYSK